MKRTLSTGVCALIALALVAFGLIYGVSRGYADERARAQALWEGENGLSSVLSYRGADGLNLCAVARRHLPADDADLLALESSARALRGSGGPAEKKRSDDAMTAAFAAVAQKLEALPGFQSSARDRGYLDMLEADLSALGASAAASAYNQAAAAYNELLDAPLTGALARLLGAQPCEPYA